MKNAYDAGDTILQNSKWFELTNAHLGIWNNAMTGVTTGQTIRHSDGNIYAFNGTTNADESTVPGTNNAIWTSLSSEGDLASAGGTFSDVTSKDKDILSVLICFKKL